MNNEMFEQIFRKILMDKGIDIENVNFCLYPVEERKKYNSMDDMFRLVVCAQLNELETKNLRFEQVIRIFTWHRDIYPMWIDVCVENDSLVNLYFSRRFRKYSEVSMYKNRDIPPFKLIEDNKDIIHYETI